MKTSAFILAACAILGLSSVSSGGVYTFPGPPALEDLVHQNYYAWGIQWTPPEGETIVGASLFFDDLWNWQNENNDHLYGNLLDSAAVGVKTWTDNQGGGNNFSGPGVTFLFDWSLEPDLVPQDRTYVFDELTLPSLITYVTNDGNFGFGLDPDCHYYNDGVRLTIQTETIPVPEPGSLFLLSLGMLALAGASRRRLASK